MSDPTSNGWVAVLLAATALAVGGLQLAAFPRVSTVGVEFVTEGAAVVCFVAGLFLVAALDPVDEVRELLYAGVFVLLIHAVTETADEVVRPPLAVTVVLEHAGLILGVGLLLWAAKRWSRIQTRRTRELRSTRSLLERTEELADVGGWELDLETDDLRWTDGTRRIHDVPDDYEPSLDDAVSFYHPDDRDRIAELVEDCRENGVPYEAELRLLTADGRVRWVQVSGEAVTDDGSVVTLYGAIRDTTDQKIRQQQLEVLNRILRHNLRNDLNVVIGRAREVLKDLPADDTAADGDAGRRAGADDGAPPAGAVDQLQQHARAIIDASEDLVVLGDKVRRYNELTEGMVDVEPTPLEPILERVREGKQSAHPAATVRVECPPEVTVLCAPALLEAALDELVENGIVHTDDDEPTVDVTVTRSDEDHVRIRVRDRGPGIPELERVALQDRDESALFHATGLGLWLANWLVAWQDGSVSVSEPEGRGTVVSVSLPAVTGLDGNGSVAGGEREA